MSMYHIFSSSCTPTCPIFHMRFVKSLRYASGTDFSRASTNLSSTCVTSVYPGSQRAESSWVSTALWDWTPQAALHRPGGTRCCPFSDYKLFSSITKSSLAVGMMRNAGMERKREQAVCFLQRKLKERKPEKLHSHRQVKRLEIQEIAENKSQPHRCCLLTWHHRGHIVSLLDLYIGQRLSLLDLLVPDFKKQL